MFRSITHDNLDRFGAAVSLTCALHCALTPLLAGLLPLAGLTFLADERIEWALIIAALGPGVISLLPSYARRHKQARPLLLFATGAGALLAARLWFAEGTPLELTSALCGAVLTACAHLLNRRLCRACPVCQVEAD